MVGYTTYLQRSANKTPIYGKVSWEVPTVMADPEEKVTTEMPAIVEKIIKPIIPGDTEKAEIRVEGADHLYREIRIENNMTNADGEAVKLKEGAEVNLVIEADPKDTVKKSDKASV